MKRTGEHLHMEFIVETTIVTMLNLLSMKITLWFISECSYSLEAHAKIFRSEISQCL
jgi:hypothetical protein